MQAPRLGRKGGGWIPWEGSAAAAVTKQRESLRREERDSPSSFPSLALDPLSPTQLCKLRRSGADADCSRVRLLCSCAAKSGTERCCSGPVRQSVRLCSKLVVLLWNDVEGAELLWDDVESAEYVMDKHRVGVPATSSLKHSHQDVPDPAVHCVSSSCGSLNIQLNWNHFHIGCT